MKKEELINNLNQLLKGQSQRLNALMDLSDDVLSWKPTPQSWNILECIAHLNLYFDFYLPEIEKCLAANGKSSDSKFRSGILGSYFIKVIKPSDSVNKMKTHSSMNPMGYTLDRSVLDILNANLLKFAKLLHHAEGYSLNRIKTKISISKLIKLKLGDTLSFIIFHNERHFKQMEDLVSLYNLKIAQ